MDKQPPEKQASVPKTGLPRIARAITAGKQIVITVSHNASIDQLVAAIGLASLINKQADPNQPTAPIVSDSAKREAPAKPARQAVRSAMVAFSGPINPAIGFIKTDEVVTPTINHYRELVVAIKKSLVDKLRYSLDKEMALIHISPFLSHRPGLSIENLNVGLGNFMIDTLIALGVDKPADLDPITGDHLEILKKDRQVITMMPGAKPSQIFGIAGAPDKTEPAKSDKKKPAATWQPINWCQPEASSLSEMIFELAGELRVELDPNIATILFTGMMSATDRIKLRAASANQLAIMSQLVKVAGVENKQLVIEYLEDKKFPAMAAPARKAAPAKQSKQEQLLTEQEALKKIQAVDGQLSQTKRELGIRVTQQGPVMAVKSEGKGDSLTKDLYDVHVTDDGRIVTGPLLPAKKQGLGPAPAPIAASAETPQAEAGSSLNPVTDIDKLGQAPTLGPVTSPLRLEPESGSRNNYQPSLIPPPGPSDQVEDSPDLAPNPNPAT